MARLPTIGNDANQWGNILNEFLRVSHHEDGTLLHTDDINNYKSIHHVISVEDFGAVGDGITDDTNAIREAYAATISAGETRRIQFNAKKYRITKPIFMGNFSSSGNGKGIFIWAGEARYWGGGISQAPANVVFEGITDQIGNTTEIIADFSASYPMFVILGGRYPIFKNIQLDGGSGATKASEGIFMSAGLSMIILENIVIKNCKRCVRIGNNKHWEDDPIIFTDYENQTGYPITTGGWMVEFPTFKNVLMDGIETCISLETAQCLHALVNSGGFICSDGSGQGIYLHSGRITMVEPSFGGNQANDILIPDDCGTVQLKIIGGHTESVSGEFLRKNRISGEDPIGPNISIFNFDGGNIDIFGSANLSIESGNINNLNLNANKNTDAAQMVNMKSVVVFGKIGSTVSPDAGKVWLQAESCTFRGDGGITDPFNIYFGDHKTNSFKNCKFTGPKFWAGVLRLNYLNNIEMSREADGDSHFAQQAYYYDCNSSYGVQGGLVSLVKAYRKAGAEFAAATEASKLIQGQGSLLFSIATNQTADNVVSSWVNILGIVTDTGNAAIGLKNIKIVNCTGTPEGMVTAPVGSIALRDDGAGGTTLYVKESGVGNTGWVPK